MWGEGLSLKPYNQLGFPNLQEGVKGVGCQASRIWGTQFRVWGLGSRL